MAVQAAALIGFGMGAMGLVTAGKARKANKKARQLMAQVRKIQNYQQKRAFINSFYQAQGNALAAGSLTGADLGSSLTQGAIASQTTQFNVGLTEFNRQERLNKEADYQLGKASKYSGISSAFQLASQFVNTPGVSDFINDPLGKNSGD